MSGAVLSGALLTGASWSTRTRWPTSELAARIAAASTKQDDATMLVVGELTLPRP